MRKVTLRQLRVFAAVARYRSFTRAARELHLTQPAVSQQIKLLEQEAGLPLFEHIGRTIHVTAAGEELLRYAFPNGEITVWPTERVIPADEGLFVDVTGLDAPGRAEALGACVRRCWAEMPDPEMRPSWAIRCLKYPGKFLLLLSLQHLDFDGLRQRKNDLKALGRDVTALGPVEQPDGVAIGLVSWITWVALSLRRSVPRLRPDRIARAWLRATRKLQRVTPRAASEGPLEYARRVAAARPDLAAPVTALALHYARLRFGPAGDAAEVATLERAVRSLAV